MDSDIRINKIATDIVSSSGIACECAIVNDDEDEDIDGDSWMYKPTKDWSKIDTINWFFWAGEKLGHDYGLMSPELAIPGEELLCLSKENFRNHDEHFGEKFHDLLHRENYLENFCKKCKNDSNSVKKEQFKRPRIWEFVRNLLFNPNYCPRWIRWEDYKNRTFRFVQSNKVAKLWGNLNNKPNMDYKKFTRAIRHYYKTKDEDVDGIFGSVDQRLVYKFGSIVKGLETDNPNFECKMLQQ